MEIGTEDIEEPRHKTELLRLTTAGSVDDGKSTLIGRLLFDSKQIFEDQLDALERSRDLTGGGSINLANLTDGLRAEREQGITIDVAYRYFSTPRRKFIIADTPGHIQYTRNMVTGASTANLAVILVDARKGVIEQTRRHAYISSLLRIPHLLICVNKMDLIDYSEKIFNQIHDEFTKFSTRIQVKDLSFIPISALKGDNVVDRSNRMEWYKGPPVLHFLEELHIANDRNLHDARFPVQYVIRPQTNEFHDFRGFAGQISSGAFRTGDPVMVLPSGMKTRIKSIYSYEGDLETAFTPMSVTLTLEDEIDIGRGDMIVRQDNLPFVEKTFDAMVNWMIPSPLIVGKKYTIKQCARNTRVIVKNISFRVDIETLERDDESDHLELNEIGRISFLATDPICFDAYSRNRQTGSFILIEEGTNLTVGAGLMCEPIKELHLPEPLGANL